MRCSFFIEAYTRGIEHSFIYVFFFCFVLFRFINILFLFWFSFWIFIKKKILLSYCKLYLFNQASVFIYLFFLSNFFFISYNFFVTVKYKWVLMCLVICNRWKPIITSTVLLTYMIFQWRYKKKYLRI